MNKKNYRPNNKNQKSRHGSQYKGKNKSARESIYQSPNMQIVEGRHAVREALLAGTRRVREIIVSDGLDTAPIIEDIQRLADELRIPLHMYAKTKFNSLTVTESAQGVMAKCEPLPELELEDLIDGVSNPFILVLDGLMDPRNLGSIIRSGECAGATGVLLPKHRSVRITPTVAKTAQGAIEHIPIATTSGIPKALSKLKDLGVWTVGMDVSAQIDIYDIKVATGPIALVLGSEGKGLGRLTRERCDVIAGIPLLGATESLNVSAASAIGCFEIVRQRRSNGDSE
ncbi:MAG: 23S rRNA (guanosine(2251)-2'-O)-methyltransferase RlmB [Acidimicrobiales bacterium]|jgi:23S rRNA (guanosine2251-2'-O)-methyltransferase|nr:23S rRNA (guanosine(2251)-2'-O)-methyltransferase RlmB [Acidimicrobiales bacterium]MDP6299279.1 23S rRNA (guanosine(2251)-2'-O)-methyltransferase RlmB [Acidimicrobiales bacterium]HJM28653.1 23S rRNA (guanosine(2251)-2'-O)-methyltransferase RlmB [Acidimicrobiales bacterium]HJM97951.1 23S rRNA (guanosine(2251)-2'-O)-methyltransferase RlmB [Acidimicrobiales bacterium]